MKTLKAMIKFTAFMMSLAAAVCLIWVYSDRICDFLSRLKEKISKCKCPFSDLDNFEDVQY